MLGEEHPYTGTSYNNLASNQNAQGKYAEAEDLYTKAANLAQSRRYQLANSGLERSVAAGKGNFSSALPAVLARNGKPEQAWQRYEDGLGRGLGDDLSVRLRYAPADLERLQQLLQRQQQLETKLLPLLILSQPTAQQVQERQSILDDKLLNLRHLQEHQTHLDKTYGSLAGKADSWQKIQAALPEDTALVGWIDVQGEPHAADPGGEHWVLLLRSQGPPVCVRLPGSGSDQKWTEADDVLPRQVYQALRTRQSGWHDRAAALDKQRLAPLTKHLAAGQGLPAVRRLVVLPSSWLDRVPVEVLAPGFEVSYAISGTLFAQQRQQPRPGGEGLLALGDPLYQKPATSNQPLPEHGLLLTHVSPGSNAARAELCSGDVLLRYAGVELRKGEDLVLEAAGPQGRPRVAIRIWRLEDEGGKPQARQLDLTVAPGPLGVVVAKELAPQALTYRRKIEEEMVAKRAEALRELPGTRYEVKRLEKLFKSKQQSTEVLLDEQASLASLQERARDGKLFRCRYLHLATHGQSDGGNGLHSRLLLARDGELSAEEILRQWHLQADLVTLSACETALGERASGERHIGFAQPLLLAGARSVVLSLWKVDDSATALLMERFYENLLGQREGLRQPLRKAEALAEARDWLRRLPREEALRRLASLSEGISRGKDRPALPRLEEPAVKTDAPKEEGPFAHPYYWAAFVLYGDGE